MTPGAIGKLLLRRFIKHKTAALPEAAITSYCFDCQYHNYGPVKLRIGEYFEEFLYCENTNTACYMMPVKASFGCIYGVPQQRLDPASALSDITPLWADTGEEGL